MADVVRSVFISYARQDATEFATRLTRDLQDAGHRVFVDLTGIAAGEVWDIRIENGIRGADTLASVMTVAAFRDESICRDEVVFALNLGKQIVPLRLDPSPGLKPSLLLARRHWIDFSADYDSGLACFLRHFKGDASVLRPPAVPTVTGVVPLDFGPEIARLTVDFTGREWLNRELERWIQSGRDRVFVVVGEPGIGKSAIAAWLSAVRRGQVVCLHFCTDRNSRTLQPVEFVASLVGQLCTQVDGFSDRVAARYPERRRACASDAFRELIVEPARDLPPRDTPLLAIIDSLDEAVKGAGETLLDLLVDQASDLPPWLKIVATTRPEESVLRLIRRLHTFELKADAADNAADVADYIEKRLPTLRLPERPSTHVVRAIGVRLPTLANGNFLYARMAFDALEDGTLSADDLGQLSPGMADFYAKAFSKLFPGETAFARDAQPILRALSAAMEPVPFALIDRLSRFARETEEVTHRRLQRLRSYLHVTGRGIEQVRYALFHKSLADWLGDASAAGSYWCSPDEARRQLAAACWQDYENDPETMSEYALRYALLHLREAGRVNDARTLSQEGIFRQRRMALGLSSFYLSYAKGDDDLFVTRLYRDLGGRGFDVWFDRESAGRNKNASVLHDARKAIDDYDRLVLVVGPQALRSATVEEEWRYAIDNGKAVTPVLRRGEEATLPEALRAFHVLDVREDGGYTAALEEFGRVLAATPPRLGTLFGVPALPPHFVARTEEMRLLREAVLGDVASAVVDPRSPITTLTGLGGIGKTALAIAFARAVETRRTFTDGIFWVAAGQETDGFTVQRHLLAILGDASPVMTMHDGWFRLRALLRDARSLVVLDDLWDPSLALEFAGVGRRSCVIVTTRDRSLARQPGVQTILIGVPPHADARMLLAQSAGVSPDDLPAAADAIVVSVGHHPLAIRIAAALISQGMSWDDLLHSLRSDLTGFEASNAFGGHTSVIATFRTAFDALPKGARQCLRELAFALPTGGAMTMSQIDGLWARTGQLAPLQSRSMLADLRDRALVELVATSEETAIRLHPLIHRLLREEIR